MWLKPVSRMCVNHIFGIFFRRFFLLFFLILRLKRATVKGPITKPHSDLRKRNEQLTLSVVANLGDVARSYRLIIRWVSIKRETAQTETPNRKYNAFRCISFGKTPHVSQKSLGTRMGGMSGHSKKGYMQNGNTLLALMGT